MPCTLGEFARASCQIVQRDVAVGETRQADPAARPWRRRTFGFAAGASTIASSCAMRSAIGCGGDFADGERERRRVRSKFARRRRSFVGRCVAASRRKPASWRWPRSSGICCLSFGEAEGGGEVERVVVELGELRRGARRRSRRSCRTSASPWSRTPNVGSRPAAAAWVRSSDGAEGVDRADAGRVDLAQQAEPVVLVVGRGARLAAGRSRRRGCGTAFRGRRRR